MYVELFGIAAVVSMVTTYALEHRSTVFILLFAISCVCASAYAVLIRSWPFAGVEAVWAVIAFRRWMHSRPVETSKRTDV